MRDTNLAERAFRLKAAFWSLPAGVAGLVLGFKLGGPLGAAVGFIALPTLVFLGTLAAMSLAGRSAGAFLLPSGSSTPSAATYSQADALIMREKYQEAGRLLEDAVLDDPNNPEPYLRLVRLYRDQLKDPTRAEEWLEHAEATSRVPPAVLRMERERIERTPRSTG